MWKSICTFGLAEQNHNNEQPRQKTVNQRDGDTKREREREKIELYYKKQPVYYNGAE